MKIKVWFSMDEVKINHQCISNKTETMKSNLGYLGNELYVKKVKKCNY